MRYSGYYVTNQGAMTVSSFDGDNLEDAKNQVAAVVDCHPSNVFLWPENEYEEPMEAPPSIPSQPVDNPTDALLDTRGQTHGDFRDHSRIAWRLKDVIHNEMAERISRGQTPLTFAQAETLDMIAHKIGRILAGDANFADHWDDIAGYARLISKEIARG